MNARDASNFFTAEERDRIRLAVSTAEHGTSGEIATMVVERSDDYREALVIASTLASILAALLVSVAIHQVMVWTFLPLAAFLYAPAYLLIKRVPALQRPFISASRRNDAVRARAVRAFFEKGLYRTRDETGILIFISLFERKVWILGDRGINSKIPPESWQQLVQKLTNGIREGRACTALCTVIASCGEELARHFPRRSDDSNELQDELLTGSSS